MNKDFGKVRYQEGQIGTIVKAEPIVVSDGERFACCLLWMVASIAVVAGIMLVV